MQRYTRIGSDGKLMKPSHYALRYGEMLEGQDGLYRLGEVNVFHWNAEQNSGSAGANLSPEQTVATWVAWMCADQGCLVVELPLTARTRAWGCGLVFSVTPTDGEGECRVYGVMIGERGCSATDC